MAGRWIFSFDPVVEKPTATTGRGGGQETKNGPGCNEKKKTMAVTLRHETTARNPLMPSLTTALISLLGRRRFAVGEEEMYLEKLVHRNRIEGLVVQTGTNNAPNRRVS